MVSNHSSIQHCTQKYIRHLRREKKMCFPNSTTMDKASLLTQQLSPNHGKYLIYMAVFVMPSKQQLIGKELIMVHGKLQGIVYNTPELKEQRHLEAYQMNTGTTKMKRDTHQDPRNFRSMWRKVQLYFEYGCQPTV